MVKEEKDKSLTVKHSQSIAQTSNGAKRILARMASDILSGMDRRSQEAILARIRVGNYEFCEPDYRQIMLWADELKVLPEALLDDLECMGLHEEFIFEGMDSGDKFSFEVNDGHIVEVSWDFSKLPLQEMRFVPGLAIKKLNVFALDFFPARNICKLHINLDCLERLSVIFAGIEKIEITSAPKLTQMYLMDPSLIEIDLSNALGLKKLYCNSCAELKKLDLSNAPALSELECVDNAISEIEVSNSTRLSKIDCRSNQLTYLDLSKNESLEYIDCSYNQLTILKLPPRANINWLKCTVNQLAELELPKLDIGNFYCDPTVKLLK